MINKWGQKTYKVLFLMKNKIINVCKILVSIIMNAIHFRYHNNNHSSKLCKLGKAYLGTIFEAIEYEIYTR